MPAVSPYFRQSPGSPRYPALWEGRVLSFCPSKAGPTGARVYDYSGYSNHGTINATLSAAWSGSPGSVRLDGTDDFVDVPFKTSLSYVHSWGISIWIRLLAAPDSSDMVAGRAYLASPGDIPYAIDMTSDLFRVLTLANNATLHQAVSTTMVSNTVGTWTHVFGYMRGLTAIGVAINGRVESEVSISATAINHTQGFAIGQLINAGRFPNMEWDDCAVYIDRFPTLSGIRRLAERRGIAYETIRPIYADDPLKSNLLDARRRAVVC